MKSKERALELARLGTMSDRQVLDKLSIEGLTVTPEQMLRWRQEAGIPAYKKPKRQFTTAELAKIRHVYSETKSFKACARAVRKDPRDIAEVLRELGDAPSRAVASDE